jgi:hypothetical protein
MSGRSRRMTVIDYETGVALDAGRGGIGQVGFGR